MAKAELINSTPVEEPPYLTLTLTESEAKTLLLVCGNVTGSQSGPRGKTSNIYYAIHNLGINHGGLEQPKNTLNFKVTGEK